MDDIEDDESIIEDGWDVLERCQNELKALCKRSCRGRFDLVDELMGRVVDVMPQIEEAWDPTFDVPFRAHIFSSLRWYLWKWMNKRMRIEVVPFEPLREDHKAACDLSTDDREELNVILSLIDEDERQVIEMVWLEELSLKEVSETIDESRATVRRLYESGMEKLQRIGKERSHGR